MPSPSRTPEPDAASDDSASVSSRSRGPGARTDASAGAPPLSERPGALLDVLLAGGRRADRMTHVEHLPGRPGRQADWPVWADASLVAGYRSMGVERPWVHQVEAAEAAWSGRHVALATSTGSGKSLAFWLPALSAVRADRAAETLAPGRIESARTRGTVLYLSPTKALAADQVNGLQRLLDASRAGDVKVSTCDGDTSFEERKWVQEYADVVLTNPDFLHFALLPNHRRWARFLRNLRYVVVDEGHSYRGVFGAHVALVLRRLARLSAHYAPAPPSTPAGLSEPASRRGHARSDSTATRGLTFVVASATTADPAVSAGRLIGVPPEQIVTVDADTSPAGRRTFALWQPPEVLGYEAARARAATADDPAAESLLTPQLTDPTAHDASMLPGLTNDPDEPATPGDPPERPRRSATAEVADLLADLTAAGARTLAFTRSRRGAESVATQTQDHLRVVSPQLARRVAAYRGGYLPEERRALEQALRSGAIRGLATTNALELGVDISGLDAVLIAGWPGTRMSVWQQAGRAGRAGADGLVAFVAREDPLDTYLVHHPEAIFAAPLEATVFDPANPYVLAPHLCAAAAEVPLRQSDLPVFGDPAAVTELLGVLVARGALRRRASGWYWTHARSAAAMTDLRGSGGSPVRVVETGTGRLLGTVDAGSADGSVHDGAVYVHQGVSYVVESLDLRDGVALVARRDVDFGTWSRSVTEITIHGIRDEEPGEDPAAVPGGEPPSDGPTAEPTPGDQPPVPQGTAPNDTAHPAIHRWWGPIGWGFGPVEVTNQVVSFQRRRLPDLQILGTEPLDLPEHTLPTTAVWWTVPAEVLDAAGIDADTAPGALHAAEHASIGLLPLLATCDRWDLGGVSTAMHVDTEQATVFVYDAYPGGAGFAERGFHLGATWLRATRAAISRCPCADGCPACVQSPKCGNFNHPLDKAAAVRLLDAVLAYAPSE
ncbi:DEAD/DEAH box helicase [Oerskovia jenensis]|uniref:DEAD/DEAH box helicase domain-containing protein n=2 Tax=Oerskovia jenensis TaxID=162169 RepID=A0ABS2LE86_9CELL|nr:DEAD/DEAH box helicase domain-containing protein [Oerskovia jenensis]